MAEAKTKKVTNKKVAGHFAVRIAPGQEIDIEAKNEGEAIKKYVEMNGIRTNPDGSPMTDNEVECKPVTVEE